MILKHKTKIVVSTKITPPARLSLAPKDIDLKVDTGASVSLIPLSLLNNMCSEEQLTEWLQTSGGINVNANDNTLIAVKLSGLIDGMSIKAYTVLMKSLVLYTDDASVELCNVPVFVTPSKKVTQALLGMDILRLLDLTIQGNGNTNLTLHDTDINTISAAKQLADGYYSNTLVHVETNA